ncbi:MAG: RNA-binding S4 domain-containing protein [Peptoniphilaceae bacterium]|nr:RNA-binding S4 domain-containing protein [Peptoniphilaceae bacterium]MDD7433648.1 RNA-binding S4 domain-containing protein [Peptoniphilaceae bacterium]MDY3076113.1 RNA-binding S4 domain-containing protein [Peptoniphilaceae bacterium]
MRIDKFLKNSRIIKRRTVAKEAADSGRITINGKVAKAGSEVQPGDRVHIAFGTNPFDFEVLSVPEVVRKEDAQSMYRVLEGQNE